MSQELFGEVGVLKWARLLHPGAAEVIFVSRDDAVMATRKYHQRELDGEWPRGPRGEGVGNGVTGQCGRSRSLKRRSVLLDRDGVAL